MSGYSVQQRKIADNEWRANRPNTGFAEETKAEFGADPGRVAHRDGNAGEDSHVTSCRNNRSLAVAASDLLPESRRRGSGKFRDVAGMITPVCEP
jgi:hypothetical protein